MGENMEGGFGNSSGAARREGKPGSGGEAPKIVIPGADGSGGSVDKQPPIEVVESGENYKSTVQREAAEQKKREMHEANAGQTWKLRQEDITETPVVDLEDRQRWLSGVLTGENTQDSSSVVDRQRMLAQVRERLHSPNVETGSPFARYIGNETVRGRAIELSIKMSEPGSSIMKVLASGETKEDLQALRLIGLSLLEEGVNEQGQQIPLAELSDETREETRRMVRAGELIGMEAERRMLERDIAAGRYDQNARDQANRIYRRYDRFAHTIDVPDAFKGKFAGMARWLDDMYGFKKEEQAKWREAKVASEARRAQKVERRRRRANQETARPSRQDRAPEASPGQPGWVEVDVAAETGIYESLAKEFPESGTPEREQVDRFMQDFGEHIEYAQYVTDQKTVGDKITALVERIAHRPALHKKVFGWRGMVRSIVSPKAANRKMGEVRTQVIRALDKVAVQTHNFRYDRYGDILSAANDHENLKPLPHPEGESADERIDTADGVEVPSASEDEIIDVEFEVKQRVPFEQIIREWSAPEGTQDAWTEWIRKASDQQIKFLKEKARQSGTDDIQSVWENIRKNPPPSQSAAA